MLLNSLELLWLNNKLLSYRAEFFVVSYQTHCNRVICFDLLPSLLEGIEVTHDLEQFEHFDGRCYGYANDSDKNVRRF